MPKTIAGADHVSIDVIVTDAEVLLQYGPAAVCQDPQSIFIALGTHRDIGAAVLPFGRHTEGSTVFLPFKADLLLSAEIETSDRIVSFVRRWERWRWSEREQTQAFEVTELNGEFVVRIPRALVGEANSIDFVIYAKDPNANDGWGWFWGCSDATVEGGIGDKYIPHYCELRLDSDNSLTRRSRQSSAEPRVRIYQLFVRLFGNTNETRKRNGTLAENGVGRFADINNAALNSIREMGFTHIWLTGVLQQATATDYSDIGQSADDTDLLKGLAGSPYAIKDYFDVCPDYARKPAERLKEFAQLIKRLHAHGLKAIIDLVPNHVARSYDSCVKPDCNFGACGGGAGAGDDTTKFFHPHNNFFYLTPDGNGPPLRLPTVRDGVAISATCQAVAAVYDRRNPNADGGHRPPPQQCDGFFEGEKSFGRVTGNNVVSWTPHINDWYETIKLNYGFDFTDSSKSIREYPNAWSPDKAIPDTWKKMDRVIAHWQSLGIDGFRCDMAHMVPPEMWSWTIAQARRGQPDVFFMGEAYDDDPAKVPGSDPVVSQLNFGQGNVLFDLLNAGFNAVYDAPAYRASKRIYDGSGWANDIDHEIADEFICHNSVRYAENHDEVRLAARREWGGLGMNVGRPVAAILYGISRGAIMLYNGQEIGEPGAGAEGFGSDDARTSIFDYWSMPEFAKWVNDHRYDGGRLSPEQQALRNFYSRLINLIGEPAFRDGKFFPLNPTNRDNERFGRLPGEQASGHWLYAFLRYDPLTGQRFLVVSNLHPETALRDVRILIPRNALQSLDPPNGSSDAKLKLIEWLTETPLEIRVSIAEAVNSGIPITQIPPLSAFYFKLVSMR